MTMGRRKEPTKPASHSGRMLADLKRMFGAASSLRLTVATLVRNKTGELVIPAEIVRMLQEDVQACEDAFGHNGLEPDDN